MVRKLTSGHKTTKPIHCGKKMHRMYIRKGTETRKWIPIGYYCSVCKKMIRNVDVTMHKRREGLENLPDLHDRVKNPDTIVLDIGYYYTKIGFAGEKEPRFILDSILYTDSNSKSFIQKAEQIEKSRKVQTQKPLFIGSRKKEIDKKIMEEYLEHLFEILEVNPKNKAIMIIEKSYKNNYAEFLYGRIEEINNSALPEEVKNQLKKRKKIEYIDYSKYVSFPRREITTLLFDSFKIAKLYFSNGELLSLYANKMYTGVVINIGAFSTRILPIYEGFIVTHAVSIRERGTQDVIQKLKNQFSEKIKEQQLSKHDTYLAEKRIRLASEDLCFISQNPKKERKKWIENEKLGKFVQLSEKSIVKLEEIRYTAPEVLFDKEMLSVQDKKGTLVEAVIESIQKCNKDLVKGCFNNIVLTGGGSLIDGFKDRFEFDLRDALDARGWNEIKFNIQCRPNRLISSWIGGSVLSMMRLFTVRNLWVSDEEYREKGASAVDRCI